MVRYNLASNPKSFVRNEKVTSRLQSDGQDCLPLTVINDETVKAGAYPTNVEISDYLGVSVVEETVQ